MPGIEAGAFHMQSERATTALHPLAVQMACLHGLYLTCFSCDYSAVVAPRRPLPGLRPRRSFFLSGLGSLRNKEVESGQLIG